MNFILLSDDILNNIFKICIYNSKNSIHLFNNKHKYLLLINKNYYKIIKLIINECFFELKCKYIDNCKLPNYIFQLFNNKIYKLPFIQFSYKFFGYTNSIDNIKKRDVNSKIMIGFDYFNRLFFTFKIKYTNINDNNNIVYKILILYQYYKNNNEEWIFESYYCDSFHDYYNTNFNNNLKILKDIIDGKKIKFNKYIISL